MNKEKDYFLQVTSDDIPSMEKAIGIPYEDLELGATYGLKVVGKYIDGETKEFVAQFNLVRID